MRHLKINKKAIAVEDFTEAVFFYMASVIAIFIILFYSTAGATQKNEQIFERNKIELANEFLIYYANYHLGKDKTVADLIIESVINEDYKSLEQTTREVLLEYFSNDNWRILIEDSDGNILKSIVGSHFSEYKEKHGEILLPLPEKNDYIKVEFSFGE